MFEARCYFCLGRMLTDYNGITNHINDDDSIDYVSDADHAAISY